MNTLLDILSFAAKGLIVFLTIAASSAVIMAIVRRGRPSGARLQTKRLNERYRRLADAVRRATLRGKEAKRYFKRRARQEKRRKPPERTVYVLDFDGDIMATHVSRLREEISALVAVAGPADEVVVRLESPGGAVSNYGLAASQLQRLRTHDIRLTVCVDKVAASGGYMMACVANQILAAPFAIIGSIGVVAQVPNMHRWLAQRGVDYEEMTAGEFKRTVSLFAEISDKGRRKFQEQLEETHGLFKQFVRANRPALDIDALATGEYWLAKRAVELGLVDRLSTSDDYLLSLVDEARLIAVTYKPPRPLRERLAAAASLTADRVTTASWTRLQRLRLQ